MAGLSLPLLIYTHLRPISIQNNLPPGQKAENRTKQSRARKEADTTQDLAVRLERFHLNCSGIRSAENSCGTRVR